MTSPTLSDWPAPAKLNLFLHIVGRRADGYHLLQTVFQFLDFGDRLTFSVRSDARIAREGDVAGLEADHCLTVRAARLLRQHSGRSTPGVTIDVRKHIPMGGGLGGGSSDAATTLWALNRLWALNLSVDDLAALGLTLGADVPVFVRGHAAWAEGVGEHLTPLDLPEPWYVVLSPRCHVDTGRIFQAAELTRNSAPITIPAFRAGESRNDCESVVTKLYPEVGRALDALARFAPSRLTGTGACVFAALPGEAEAKRCLASCRADGWDGFAARGMNRSPLVDKLSG